MAAPTRMLGAILTGAEQLRREGLLVSSDDNGMARPLWDLPFDMALGAEQLAHAKEEIHRRGQLCAKLHAALNTSARVLESRKELINTIKTTVLRDSILFSREDAAMREEYKARFTSLLDDQALLGMHRDGLEMEYRDRITELEGEARRSTANEEARIAAVQARETRNDELKEAKRAVDEQLDAQKREYARLDSQFHILKENYRTASERSRDATQKCFQMQSELDSQRTQIDSLTQQLDDAHEQLASAQVALNTVHTNHSAQDKFASELAVTLHRLGEGMQRTILQAPISRTLSTVGTPTSTQEAASDAFRLRRGSLASSAAGGGRSPSLAGRSVVQSDAGSVTVPGTRRTPSRVGVPPVAVTRATAGLSSVSNPGGVEAQDALSKATQLTEAAMNGHARDPRTLRALRDALNRMRPTVDKLPLPPLTADDERTSSEGEGGEARPSLTHVVHQFYCLLSFCLEAMVTSAEDTVAVEQHNRKDSNAAVAAAAALTQMLKRAAFDIRSKAVINAFQDIPARSGESPPASLTQSVSALARRVSLTTTPASNSLIPTPSDDLSITLPHLIAALTSPPLLSTGEPIPGKTPFVDVVDYDTKQWRSRFAPLPQTMSLASPSTMSETPRQVVSEATTPQHASLSLGERPQSATSTAGPNPMRHRTTSVVTIQSTDLMSQSLSRPQTAELRGSETPASAPIRESPTTTAPPHPLFDDVHEAIGALFDAYGDVLGNVKKIQTSCATTLTKLQAKLFTQVQAEDRAGKDAERASGAAASKKLRPKQDHPLVEAMRVVASLEKVVASKGASITQSLEGAGSRGLGATMIRVVADNPVGSSGSPPKILLDPGNQRDLTESLVTSIWGNSNALPDYLTTQTLNSVRTSRESLSEVVSKIKDSASEIGLLVKHDAGEDSLPPPPVTPEQLAQLLQAFGIVSGYCGKLVAHAQLTATAAINAYQRAVGDGAPKVAKPSIATAQPSPEPVVAVTPQTSDSAAPNDIVATDKKPKLRTVHESTQTPPVHVAPSEDAYGNFINAPWVPPDSFLRIPSLSIDKKDSTKTGRHSGGDTPDTSDNVGKETSTATSETANSTPAAASLSGPHQAKNTDAPPGVNKKGGNGGKAATGSKAQHAAPKSVSGKGPDLRSLSKKPPGPPATVIADNSTSSLQRGKVLAGSSSKPVSRTVSGATKGIGGPPLEDAASTSDTAAIVLFDNCTQTDLTSEVMRPDDPIQEPREVASSDTTMGSVMCITSTYVQTDGWNSDQTDATARLHNRHDPLPHRDEGVSIIEQPPQLSPIPRSREQQRAPSRHSSFTSSVSALVERASWRPSSGGQHSYSSFLPTDLPDAPPLHTHPKASSSPLDPVPRPTSATLTQQRKANLREPEPKVQAESLLQHDFNPFYRPDRNETERPQSPVVQTTVREAAVRISTEIQPFSGDAPPTRPQSSMGFSVAIGKGGTTGTGRRLGERARPATGSAARSSTYRVQRVGGDTQGDEVVSTWTHRFSSGDDGHQPSEEEPPERNTHSPSRSSRAGSVANPAANNHISRRLQFLRRSPDRLRAMLRDCDSNTSSGKVLPSVANPVSAESFSLACRTHPALAPIL